MQQDSVAANSPSRGLNARSSADLLCREFAEQCLVGYAAPRPKSPRRKGTAKGDTDERTRDTLGSVTDVDELRGYGDGYADKGKARAREAMANLLEHVGINKRRKVRRQLVGKADQGHLDTGDETIIREDWRAEHVVCPVA